MFTILATRKIALRLSTDCEGFESLGDAQGFADAQTRTRHFSSVVVLDDDGNEIYEGHATFCEDDLAPAARPLLDLPLRDFAQRYGALGDGPILSLCKELDCAARHLDSRTVRELMATNEGGYIERWACRWIIEAAR